MDLAAADLNSGNVSFYFINGSSGGTTVNVSYSVSVNGKQLSVNGSIKVFRPQVDSFTSQWTNLIPPWDMRTVAGRITPILKFGTNASEETSGIFWTAKVTAPPNGAGKIAFLQLTDFSQIYTPSSGTPDPPISSNGDVLDHSVSQTDPDAKAMYGPPVAVNPGIQAVLKEGDSPNIGGASTDVGVSFDGKFKTYLMYKPSVGGIWVTLGVLNWNANASAAKNGGVWSINAGAAPASGGAGPGSSNSTVLLEWNDSGRHILGK